MNSSALPWCFMLSFFPSPSLSTLSHPLPTPDTYNDQCSQQSLVLAQKVPLSKFPLPRTHKGYYTGGDNLLIKTPILTVPVSPNSFFFEPRLSMALMS
ncbi:hypothetical protein FCV25MIE_27071 [Fagus crenata]